MRLRGGVFRAIRQGRYRLITVGALVLALTSGAVSAQTLPQHPGPAKTAPAATTAPSQPKPASSVTQTDGTAEPTTDNAVYAYDAAGRLVGVSDPTGQTARYRYDEAGNRLGIDRYASSTLSVLSVVPVRAKAGATVTLAGTGFSATAAGDTVAFGDTTATVTRASATRLVVTVPVGADDGSVAVTVAGSTAKSAEAFSLAPSGPAIASMAPLSGPAGTEVTIQGTGLASTASDNVVRFNGGTLAELVSATTTTLTVKVPEATTTGRITVETPDGKAVSPADYTVPLSGDEADFETTVRTSVTDASPPSAAVTQAGKRARVLFDADQGRDISFGFTQSTFPSTASVQLIDPLGDTIGTGSVLSASNGSSDFEVRNLTASGTYTLVIDPLLDTTGAVTVTVSYPAGGELSFTGDPAATAMSRVGQDGLWTFGATKGDSFSLGIDTAGMSDGVYARLYEPDRDQVDFVFVSKASNGSLDVDALPATGRYTLYLDPANAATGTAKVTIAHYAEAGTLSPDGAATQSAVTRPGQDGVASFTAETGKKVSLGVTSTGFASYVTLRLYAPDGTSVDSFIVSSRATTEWDSTALPQTGTYRLEAQPASIGTGTLAITLARPVDVGKLSSTGSTAAVAITRLGQNAEATFDASAGNDLSLGITENTFTSYFALTVIAPSGAKVGTSVTVSAASAKTVGLSDLPETGTYTVVMDPYSGAQGSFKLTLSADLTVAVGIDGASVPVTVSRPGQRVRVTFTSPDSADLGLGLTGNTINQATYVNLIGSAGGDGDYLAQAAKNTAQAVHVNGLATGSVYTLLLEPQSAGTGGVTLWLSTPVKAGALSQSGGTGAIARPGQALQYTLDAKAGDGDTVVFTGTTITGSTRIMLLAPGATTPSSLGSLSTSTTDAALRAPLVAGTYRLLLQPLTPVTGQTTATLVPDVNAGTLTVGGGTGSATIATAGQNARYTFTGTSGQKLTLSLGSTPPYAWYLSVFGPDGKWLVDARYLTTSTTSYAMAALPASGTYTVTVDPALLKTGTYSIGLSTTALASSSNLSALKAEQALADKVQHTEDSTGAGTDRGKAQTGTAPTGVDAWQPDKQNLTGRDWVTRRGSGPKAPTRLRAPPGTTALSGHVLKLDGTPLAKATVRVGATTARTDSRGRFLLSGISANATTLVIDGSSAHTNKRNYGRFDIRIHPKAGLSIDLGFPVWMTPLDTRHTVTFDAPAKKEIVLTTPKIPGLEVRIPKGSVIRDENGKTVTELGITAIPIDRPPFPLPKNSIVPVYFTVQPGGTYVFPKGAQIIYPNYTHEPPGTQVDFMDYDPGGKGWYVYGHGKVNADATQVVPDSKTRVWAFTGAMFNTTNLPNWLPSWLDDTIDWLSGDPVNLSTGLLTDAHTDLAVDDALTPVDITRTYWQGDTASRAFGIGRDLTYNAFLHSEEQYQEVDLYLPGGQKIHYDRTSAGTSFLDAVFELTGASGQFRGTKIDWNGNTGWDLTFPDGTVWVFPQYAPLKEIRDRYGNTLSLTRAYTTRGNLTRLTTSGGRWIALTYDAHNRVTQARDNAGRTVSYTYDSAGRLDTVTDPAGKVSSYTYDGTSNRIATAKDARGIVYMSNTYNADGRVQHQTLTEGQEYSFAYTTTGTGEVTATEATQPGGAVRRVEFDGGYGTSDTQAYGSALARKTVYERGTGHRVNAVVDPYGRRTELSYDANSHVTKVVQLAETSSARSSDSMVFDGAYDQPGSVTDALGHKTTFTYDADGNLTKTTDPEGRETSYTYNSAGQVKTATDAAHAVTAYAYANGNLTAVTDSEGRTSTQFTDAAGRPITLTDESGSATTVTYDKLNQTRTVTDPLGHTTALGYDANGNLTTLTDARGNTTTWAYDNADRPKSATDPLGAQALFAYDAAGFLKTATNRSGVSAVAEHDLLGRPKRTQYGVDSVGQAESTVSYDYGANDLPQQITDSQAGNQSFTYDAYDRVASTTGPTGTVGYTYDASDQRTSMTAAGTSTAYGYDASGILTSVKSGTQEVAFGLDAVGREKTASLPGGITRTTGYDTTGVITSIAYAQGAKTIGDLAYTRDERALQTGLTGSLAKVALPAAESGTQFGKDNRITSYDGRTFTYDARGQLTNDGLRTYTWNARGELTGLAKAGTTSSFGYAPFGGRVSKTIGGTSSRYLTDGTNPLAEQDGSGATTATVATSGLDEFLSRTESGTTQVYLTDALGSVVGLANSDGTVATTYAYDPGGTPTASGSATTNPYTFTGREDDGTGLLYYRNRYYDPQTGRFISQDPSGQAGGTNLYQYALSSPTTYTDPTGNNPMIAACIIGGLMDGGLDWLTQRLSGRKVNWGQVGMSAATGCLASMLGEGLGALAEGRAGSRIAQCATPNSFTGDTPVLMADGTRKPIKDVKVGDTVIATDPNTGETVPRKVTALIKGTGDKQLVDITVDTDGSAGTKTGALTATSGHPFWVPALHQWVEAGNLTASQWLQTSSGTRVQITAIRHHTKQTPVYNLTVDDLHTYYVGTGQGVLVHNAQPGCGPHLALGLRSIHGGRQGLLDEFARSVGAITYTDAMFNVPIGGVMTEPMVRDMIDVVVSRSGRMTFNMHGITRVDEMLAGGESYVATRVTAMELRYICGNAAARAITTFVNGDAPC
ncbi:RHS repeat-associated core domain-containing protein [Streptomyces sp. Agncl-13]|uniref:RHS repeat-associated core domain-containing protein n=1 Tax=Streptomyces sp. Agncl-13 TaxID=3400628 RepID=UPI003A86FB20